MDILKELEKIGAVMTDKHFVYASGAHGPGYITMDPMFPNAKLMKEICKRLVEPFDDQFDAIVAPATGGIVLSVLCSQVSGRPGLWADKSNGGFAFERTGFVEHIKNSRVLVVEDLLTTGSSVKKVCQQVEDNGGQVIGISTVCNRGGVTHEALDVPRLESLVSVSMTSEPAETCQLCASGRPIVVNVGHGDDFQQANPNYPGGYITL